MKKCIFASLLLLWCCGCTTPQIVYECANVARVATEEQKNMASCLLSDFVKANTLDQARAVAVKQIEIAEQWDRCSKALYRIITYLDTDRYIQYAATVAPGLGSAEIADLMKSLARSVPTDVREDLLIIKTEEQAFYDFNVKLLKKLTVVTPEDVQTNIGYFKRASETHRKAQEALKLLGEYLDSSEYIKAEEARAVAQQLTEAIKTLANGAVSDK